MKIDPKELIPLPPLDQFQWGGTFYLKKAENDYERVNFDIKDPFERSIAMQWLTDQQSKLFIVRNRPWGTITKLP